VLTKDDFRISFDQIIKTSHGHVNGIELIPVINMANLTMERGTVLDINDFHRSMGHVHEDSLRIMADYYGLKLRGQFHTCFECSLAKIRQRNVGKTTEKTSEIPGERLMVDISSVRSPSLGGSKFWIMVLDDCTDMCWSMFVSAKSHLPEQVVMLIKRLRLDQRCRRK
jgi:hypothetical protein